MTFRLFIAVDIPDQIKEIIKKTLVQMIDVNSDIKFVACENLHLTLKFLGETNEECINKVEKLIDKVAQNHFPFSVLIKNLGWFPNFSSPKIFWLGIEQDQNNLKMLSEDFEEQFSILGFEKQTRSFQSHLTIGRVKGRKNLEKINRILEKEKGSEFGKFIVDHVVLMRSILKATGPQYLPIYKTALGR
jgi:2'-5' RNA ligase